MTRDFDDQFERDLEKEPDLLRSRRPRPPLDERGTVRVQIEKLPPAPTDSAWLDILRKAGAL